VGTLVFESAAMRDYLVICEVCRYHAEPSDEVVKMAKPIRTKTAKQRGWKRLPMIGRNGVIDQGWFCAKHVRFQLREICHHPMTYGNHLTPRIWLLVKLYRANVDVASDSVTSLVL
jgi:hypothetical protein